MRHPAGPGPIVVKIGSSSLTRAAGGLDEQAVASVAAQVAAVHGSGRPVVLVTSGAVAAGLPALGMTGRPGDIPGLQAAAAVGQSRLMERYTTVFDAHGIVCGQVLLTRDVLAGRDQYLHARDTLDRLLNLRVVPVVNENDTVVVDELRFGDNDRLAAVVAHLVGAVMLVILTDTPGLLSGDPRFDAAAALIDAVRTTDSVLDRLGAGGSGPLGSGGVATKVAAARMAAWSGIPTVIAPAGGSSLAAAIAGEQVGTWVDPHPSSLSARKLWIAFGMPSSGSVMVDDGAVTAISDHGRSLLPAGVTDVRGEFDVGAAVEVVDRFDRLIAKGRAGLSAAQMRAAIGRHSHDAGGEVVHRDDLVVFTVER